MSENMETILDYSYDKESECGANFSKLERKDPQMAERANNLCKVLGLYGFWKRVNSARWEISKALIIESGHNPEEYIK